MRVVSAAGALGEPLAGLLPVVAGAQGGLLDVALSPAFDTDRLVYWSFSEPRGDEGNGTSVARAKLSADSKTLEGAEVVLRTQPSHDNGMHFGSRVLFGPDGMLYVTTGERSDLATRPQAQQADSHFGKVLRVRPDGSVPDDNPFTARAAAKPELWTIGHRNVQSAAFDAQGRLWTVDMGPQGGDELNLIERGANYGWPLQTFGEEYSGQPVPGGATEVEGMVSPRYYWDPVIAPSGAEFYDGAAFPAWRGNLFVGALRGAHLVRLVIDGDRVTGEERLLEDRGKRVRDVREDASGVLYVVTDEDEGELWKIVPR
jgi:glucose/arabinose dehydrogenase